MTGLLLILLLLLLLLLVAGTTAGSALDNAVKHMTGPAPVICYVLRVLGGDGAAVKEEILNLPDVKQNQLVQAALCLEEIDTIPKLGEAIVIKGSRAKDQQYYLRKTVPKQQPGNLQQELDELMDVAAKCAELGIILGEFYQPLAERMSVVQKALQRIQDRAQEELLNMQVASKSQSLRVALWLLGTEHYHRHTFCRAATAVCGRGTVWSRARQAGAAVRLWRSRCSWSPSGR